MVLACESATGGGQAIEGRGRKGMHCILLIHGRVEVGNAIIDLEEVIQGDGEVTGHG